MVNRAVGKENKEVVLDGRVFLRLVLSRPGMFADDCDWVLQWDAEQDPLKTVGREICRQRWQNRPSNQGLAWEVYVGPMPWLSVRRYWFGMRMEGLRIDCLCGRVS